MEDGSWQTVLVVTLALNAVLGLGYRVYRLSKGGPIADVWGQAVLGFLLAGLAVLIAADAGWARWATLLYGLLFGLLVMPVWTLAVLIPLRPAPPDYAFATVYWAALIVIVIASLAL